MDKITLGTPYNIELKTTANIDGYTAYVYLEDIEGCDCVHGVKLVPAKDYNYTFNFPVTLSFLNGKTATLKLYVYHENSRFLAYETKTTIVGAPEVTVVKPENEFSVTIKPTVIQEETPEIVENCSDKTAETANEKKEQKEKKNFDPADVKKRVTELLKSKKAS